MAGMAESEPCDLLWGKKYRIESDKSSGFETSKGIQLVTWSWLQNSNFPFLDKHQYVQNWNFYQISSLIKFIELTFMNVPGFFSGHFLGFKSDGIFLRSIIYKPIAYTFY